ncbi:MULTISPECIES: (deoxy)nucleoside triphosphate pyrophosphohydrolase [Bacillus cereus group]|uniref:8-oxo-dGTP diphosphatase n=1 Tax=Bacillus toyonensis TaxID=155322 RepID=A0ABX6G6C5_9BACI|nr:(deoxy)nucleoside triphosphate pyrophosphohydrolase [Bacillus toyonensis]MDM5255124.1 (deoxy)nucleoside triphosphate pyrophosphohydrolase [Bacillus toyonensis]NSL67328.1 (deoxy)nucleoside triphosphate pyrophosphohydrolase [Bacillus toyonensis]PDZ30257.1 8-oxo-dGTP diphosphatase MutT [Bacillus toyonensis]PHF36783.1 8-oxo-dGTP diphosphatase MutT [Bacillus toyonensis]QHA17418.1 NUDIX domain-containing protein [Bacillus toyonensis]
MKKKVSVVGAVILNDDNEVLCALRSPRMSLPNYWEFPGGKINLGEDPREALVREIKEELNCTIIVGDQVVAVEHEYENIIVHLVTFKARIKSGSPKALEHSELRWISLNNLKALKWAPADIQTVNLL